MLRFSLPKAAEFDAAVNYAENLRPATIGGQTALCPVGHPLIMASHAGTHTCRLPDGRLLSVGADFRTVSVDSTEAGTLSADFRAAMADGERIALFTDGGVQWISAGMLQPPAGEQISVELTPATISVGLAATVDAPSPLRGSYPRLTDPLQEVDCRLFADAFTRARKSLSAQAALRGLLIGQARIGWRIADSEGRTLALGEPRLFGTAAGSETLKFSASKSDSTFTITGNPAMNANAWTLNLAVGRAGSDFWRRRARVLEILLWADCDEVSSAYGRFSEAGASTASLGVTPEITTTDGRDPIVAARFDLPLEGLQQRIYFANIGSYDPAANPAAEDFTPLAIGYGGTLRAYSLVGEPGVIAIARSDNPLAIRLRARICDGRILRICVPVGNGGGWNYGRHHFLAFTTAGIFAVSIDSALRSVSAAPVSMLTIGRADAVATATDAIYCATRSGELLRIKGARVEQIACPVRPVALLWVEAFGELLAIDSGGTVTALTPDGLASRRTLRTVRSFIEPSMALGAAGELLDFSREQSGALPVVWRRRVATDWKRQPLGRGQSTPWRTATFTFDAAEAAHLRLTIAADSGGGAQRLLELEVNGAVNAPVSARYRSPRRPWLTFGLNGVVAAPARLIAISDSALP